MMRCISTACRRATASIVEVQHCHSSGSRAGVRTLCRSLGTRVEPQHGSVDLHPLVIPKRFMSTVVDSAASTDTTAHIASARSPRLQSLLHDVQRRFLPQLKDATRVVEIATALLEADGLYCPDGASQEETAREYLVRAALQLSLLQEKAHAITAVRHAMHERGVVMPDLLVAAADHMCSRPADELVDTDLDDIQLPAGPNNVTDPGPVPHKGKITWLTVLERYKPASKACPTVLAADKRGRLCIVQLHGFDVTFGSTNAAARTLLSGTVLGVKEPVALQKVVGCIELPCFNPTNVIVVPKHKAMSLAAHLGALPRSTVGPLSLPQLSAPQDVGTVLRAVASVGGKVPDEAIIGTPTQLQEQARRLTALLRHEQAQELLAIAARRTDADATLPPAARKHQLLNIHTAAAQAAAALRDWDSLSSACDALVAVEPTSEAAVKWKTQALIGLGKPRLALNWASGFASFMESTGKPISPGLAEARDKAAVAVAQSEGKYDITKLSWDNNSCLDIQAYYGPIEVGPAGDKGWGLFTTRAVKEGELLFAEPMLTYSVKTAELSLMTVAQSNMAQVWQETSRAQVRCAKSPWVRSLFSMFTSRKAPRDPTMPCPSMEQLRNRTLPDPGPLSFYRLWYGIDNNVFNMSCAPEPSHDVRVELQRTLTAWPPLDVKVTRRGSIEEQEVRTFNVCNPFVATVAVDEISPEQLETLLKTTPVEEKKRLLRNEGDAGGNRALHVAIASQAHAGKDHRKMEILLKDGCDPNERNTDGVTPLMLACMSATFVNLKTVEVLLDHGANPNAVANDGSYPLMHAALVQNAELVQLLLSRGAYPYIDCGKFGTAADIAPGLFTGVKNRALAASSVSFAKCMMNHDNASREKSQFYIGATRALTIGPVSFVHAARDFAAGEEVTTLYYSEFQSDEEVKKAQDKWGIK